MFNNELQKQNLLGTFYQSGNLVFDNNTLYSCVHNMVKRTDFIKNTSQILPFQTTCQLKILALNPNKVILVAIDMSGRAVVYNAKGGFIIAEFNFKGPVRMATFSPDGNLFGIGQDSGFTVYESPSSWRTFQPFILIKKYKSRHTGDICGMSFTPDSRFLLTAGQDNMIYMSNLFPIPSYITISFEVHRSKILGMQCSQDLKYVYSFDQGGNIFCWKWVQQQELTQNYVKMREMKKRKMARNRGHQSLEEYEQEQEKIQTQEFSELEKRVAKGRYILAKKLSVSQQNNYLKRYFYNTKNGFLATAYSHGKFSIYKLVEQTITQIQTYSVGTTNKISTITVNDNCTWIGLGIKNQAQLVVWQWKSQSYIFNQSGFTFQTKGMVTNGNSLIATGSVSGKVRLWDQRTGFCLASFEEHVSEIKGLKFSNQFTLFSVSIDGTVNGYDTIRYKKFRTFKPDKSNQLTSITCDPSGQIVFAGGFDPFQVYGWNVQTGNMIQVIGGHTGPISCLQFVGEQYLVSGSWDHSIRIHDVFSRKGTGEVLDHGSQVLSIAVDSSGYSSSSSSSQSVVNKSHRIAVTTMRGQIYIWQPKDGQLVGIINCEFQGGKSYTSHNHKHNKSLTCIQFSPCGKFIIGGGISSKYLMVYDVQHRMLYRKIPITQNRDLKGVMEKLNSRYVKDGVGVYQMELRKQEDAQVDRYGNGGVGGSVLPGSKAKEAESVRTELEVQIRNVKFLNSTVIAVQTSFGVLICSTVITKKQHFNPYELTTNLNPKLLPQLLLKKQYASALTLTSQLNLSISKVLSKIPIQQVRKVANELNKQISQRIIENLSKKDMSYREIVWVQALLSQGGIQKVPIGVRKNVQPFLMQVRTMRKSMGIMELVQIMG